MLSKRFESTEVDRRTWLHVPSGTRRKEKEEKFVPIREKMKETSWPRGGGGKWLEGEAYPPSLPHHNVTFSYWTRTHGVDFDICNTFLINHSVEIFLIHI